MKHLKNKIKNELLLLEAKAAAQPEMEMEEQTLHLTKNLAKTFYYLHKVCEIMEKDAEKPVLQPAKTMI